MKRALFSVPHRFSWQKKEMILSVLQEWGRISSVFHTWISIPKKQSFSMPTGVLFFSRRKISSILECSMKNCLCFKRILISVGERKCEDSISFSVGMQNTITIAAERLSAGDTRIQNM